MEQTNQLSDHPLAIDAVNVESIRKTLLSLYTFNSEKMKVILFSLFLLIIQIGSAKLWWKGWKLSSIGNCKKKIENE